MPAEKNYREFLPADGFAGSLIGRVWAPGDIPGPSPVWIAEDGVWDLGSVAPTCAEFLNQGFSPRKIDRAGLARLGGYAEIMANTLAASRDANQPYFLSPVDLQAVKACGVTFAVSLLERVIEERAAGDAGKA